MVFDLKSKYLNYKSLDIDKLPSSSDDEQSEVSADDHDSEMPLFIIDKTPASSDVSTPITPLITKKKDIENDNNKRNREQLSSTLRLRIIEKPYITVTPEQAPSVVKEISKKLALADKEDEIMKKSVFQPGFEKLHAIPPYEETKGQQKRNKKKEKEKTRGPNWFNMPATELTDERKNDLAILQMRQSLDPKRFYKKNDRTSLPKYFQVGTIVESPADFYHSRIPKKQRKRTIVEELLADADFRTQNKKKYMAAMKNKLPSFKIRKMAAMNSRPSFKKKKKQK